MEATVCIGEIAERLFKIYNSARPDAPASSYKVELCIYPFRKFSGDLPKTDVELQDCKLRFRFILYDGYNPEECVYETKLDMPASSKISLITPPKQHENNDKILEFKDCVKEYSQFSANPFISEKAYKFYGKPEKINVCISSENSDIKFNSYLNKAFKQCARNEERTK